MPQKRTQPFVIGISGRMKSGKDQVATYLTEFLKTNNFQSDIIRYAFADPLKQGLINIFGLSKEDVYTQEGKASFNKTWGMTNRKILQKFGTDAVRKHLHRDAWIFAMDSFLKKQDPNAVVIIPDVRFINEAELILANYQGIIIYVERPSIVSNLTKLKEAFHLVHPSEQPIPIEFRTYEINNRFDLEFLKNEVEMVWMNIQPKLPLFEASFSSTHFP